MLNQRGYSILELMMVVCIIGVLTMIAMTEYNKIHNRAFVGAAMSDLQLLRKALSMYDAEQGAFPLAGAASPVALTAMLIDPTGQPYINPPNGNNFRTFQYIPPNPGERYGDYTMRVVCNDHWLTQITVHNSQDMEIIRLN
ncbi:prepilin-type N-terminal cleavage/methylation domain-containing protein [bacterium]|nr:prepilin-type N-terminal cleavage/methylation domain-containing protein [bacterium]MBU1982847.1 prepilin-type N-terminal cleavage/methylation domain-containing protein [bacterium]